ncbi:MAG: phosphate-binding protein [Chlorobiaceae bacterium]|nr:phosphate-binding protein [Chlorobiaceae bacterium]
MNKIRGTKAYKQLLPPLSLLLLLLMLSGCRERPAAETARSGVLIVSVDRQLQGVADIQGEVFSRHYPDSRITIVPDASGKTLMPLLNQKAGAALISGELQPQEDSLVASLNRPLRREPVGRDALVCIVNSNNRVATLSLKELSVMFSRKGSETTPLIRGDDYRLETLLAGKIGKKREDLRAWACRSDGELIRRVGADRSAVGVLFRSAFNAGTISDAERNLVTVVPLVSDRSGGKASLPTRQNIFDGSYPLVTTVYYVYYPGNVLATGFGSWLSSSGQTVFERSALVPFKLLERTIILK